ncbi:hypothetical protein DCOP10_119141 [Armatimonadetes bacterium DC]|nr:hypothetical protein DCOP10_119141 [Armatimonadetes bacterium DC]
MREITQIMRAEKFTGFCSGAPMPLKGQKRIANAPFACVENIGFSGQITLKLVRDISSVCWW